MGGDEGRQTNHEGKHSYTDNQLLNNYAIRL